MERNLIQFPATEIWRESCSSAGKKLPVLPERRVSCRDISRDPFHFVVIKLRSKTTFAPTIERGRKQKKMWKISAQQKPFKMLWGELSENALRSEITLEMGGWQNNGK